MESNEEKDKEKMLREVQEEKLRCFDRLKMLSRMLPEELKQAGYSSGNSHEAVFSSFCESLREVNKLYSNYVKKYQD